MTTDPTQPPGKVRTTSTARHLSDLRGAAQLATEATLAITSLVEAMHAGIASVPGLRAPAQTRGITGLVYRTIRATTRTTGTGVDLALGQLSRLLSPDPSGEPDAPWPERESLLSALNGVIGDHLAATASPLALPMVLRHQGRVLTLEHDSLKAALPKANGRLLILMHGLCRNDLQWQQEGHDHGAALARAGGYTPIYLRYNSGLPIHRNGAQFADLMAKLLDAWPHPLQRVVLLAHSMGGLVARSALHQGLQAGQGWVQHIDDAVFLGTPHHGAPLERAGHGIDIVLGAAPYAAPLARLGRIRSAGITDLRHGQFTEDGQAAALPAHPRCYAVAAHLGLRPNRLQQKWVGDGLVPVDSALGRHPKPAQQLNFDPSRQLVMQDMNHMELLHKPKVTEVLQRWLVEPGSSMSGHPAQPANAV